MTVQTINLDWNKSNGLIPAIIQDSSSNQVLMLGYMNIDALNQTQETGFVTFFSRSKNRLWVKGETSGNYLSVSKIYFDCDNDALLIKVKPAGPTCHQGTISCFADQQLSDIDFLLTLEQKIEQRRSSDPKESYVAKLFELGIARMAQKVGEEGVEVALACMQADKAQISEEAADLVFHLMVLLRANDLSLSDIVQILDQRNKEQS